MRTKSFPDIIQGGMGVGVSLWPLARAVSLLGGIGVISGTLVEVVVARTLQMGDPCGYIRWALAPFHFPIKEVAERVIAKYYIPGGKAPGARFKDVPLFGMNPEKSLTDLIIVSNFAQVFLAKEGHQGLVGINLLEKVQLPTICALYGAMLAGVDCVFIGAGIPKQIPRVLDNLSRHDYAAYKIGVEGAVIGDDFRQCFDPKAFLNGRKLPRLRRPGFLPIVSAPSIIKRFFMDEPEMIQGFSGELPPAGGHNAPPRGEKRFNERRRTCLWGTRRHRLGGLHFSRSPFLGWRRVCFSGETCRGASSRRAGNSGGKYFCALQRVGDERTPKSIDKKNGVSWGA